MNIPKLLAIFTQFSTIINKYGLRKAPTYLIFRIWHERVRHILPSAGTAKVEYNGVVVRNDEARFFETVVPRLGNNPVYESAIVRQVRSLVTKGENVTVVGAGWGVVTTVAANQVGETGTVTAYEGSKKMYERAKNTVRLNGVSDIVKLRHATIGDGDHVWYEEAGSDVLTYGDLDPADVLLLDCEGEEQHILNNIDFRPRLIIVETHGHLDSSTEETLQILTSNGYKIRETELEDPYGDVSIVTAVKQAG